MGLQLVQSVDTKIHAYGMDHSRKCKIYAIEFAGKTSNYATFIASVPDLPETTIEAAVFDDLDTEELKDLGVDMTDFGTARRCRNKPIDLILGNDISPFFLKDAHRVVLPSGKYIDLSDFCSISYPTPRHCPLMDIEIPQSSEINYALNLMLNHLDAEYDESQETDEYIAKLIEQLYRVENLGIEPASQLEKSKKSQEQFLEEFENSLVTTPGGTVQVSLPWNGRQERMGNNKKLAFSRLLQLIGKLTGKPDLTRSFEKILQEQLDTGIIERCTPDMDNQGPLYYAPQSAVFKANSQNTKVRIVGDSSAHQKDQLSVNECLDDGPNLLKKIPGLFLRHRARQFAVTGDIAKAFHQVALQEKDRNVTRFLWVQDITKPPVGENLIEYRFTKIPFGLRPSPYLLAAYIRHFLLESKDTIAHEIERNIYVDNLMVTTDSADEVPCKIAQLKEQFRKMQMHVREIASNNLQAIDKLPAEDKNDTYTVKFLGYQWNTEMDTISVKLPKPKEGIPTKRDVASFLGKLYDPMGYTDPVLVNTKRLIQELWEAEVGWKQPIPERFVKPWQKVGKNYNLDELTISRKLQTRHTPGLKPELVVFSDASKYAYAAAVYAVYRHPDGFVESQLIGAKSKIRPSHGTGWSIPRLELLAMDMGVRLARSLWSEFEEDQRPETLDIFSDSIIALFWTLTKERKREWVHNRVSTIHDIIQELNEFGVTSCFHHVRTDENPADLATRGKTAQELQGEFFSFWFEGAAFLKQPRESWTPQLEGELDCSKEDQEKVDEELVEASKRLRERVRALPRKARIAYMALGGTTIPVTLATMQVMKRSQTGLKESYRSHIPFHYTKDLSKLSNIVTRTLQFISKLATKAKRKLNSPILSNFQEANEIEEKVERAITKKQLARQLIINEHYKEMDSSGVKFRDALRPYQSQDGLWRTSRNIGNANLPNEAKEPILIHNEHPLALLIAIETHVRNVHLPVVYLQTALRSQYAIKKDGQLAKKVVHHCVDCRKAKAYPFKYPFQKNIHSSRTVQSPPFQKVGLDYAGPFDYRIPGTSEKGKCYILVYTCLTTRCTHLELIPDATTASYLITMKSIFAQRGVPTSIYSDNSKTFTLGHKMLEEDFASELHDPQISSLLANEGVTFQYITPLAPWQGGSYERIVGVTKKQLRKHLGKKTLTFCELNALLKRVEGAINARPLTQNTTIADAPTIRPIDFVLPKVRLHAPQDRTLDPDHKDHPASEELASAIEQETRERMRQLDTMLDEIWAAWSTSYILMMRENTLHNERFSPILPKEGQIVLVVTENIPRHTWPLGKIIKVNGPPEAAKSADVWFQGRVKTRAVNQLVPLELDYENIPETTVPRDSHIAAPSPTLPRVPFPLQISVNDKKNTVVASSQPKKKDNTAERTQPARRVKKTTTYEEVQDSD
ncbi:hypothetical protein B9Z55_022095 [Caenorhabditis nigoni]|uniref:Integrase catalytic domain-containing protein n=1 Tax=Caenorhabditis nigoni TaxID=1611254 RepID=A0A2G5TUR4_9PELO|nr:hypothetical protein B9Z55_022095 [Caenorhabditis nigoni]